MAPKFVLPLLLSMTAAACTNAVETHDEPAIAADRTAEFEVRPESEEKTSGELVLQSPVGVD